MDRLSEHAQGVFASRQSAFMIKLSPNAAGLRDRGERARIGQCLSRAWLLNQTLSFDALLGAIDVADVASRQAAVAPLINFKAKDRS